MKDLQRDRTHSMNKETKMLTRPLTQEISLNSVVYFYHIALSIETCHRQHMKWLHFLKKSGSVDG